MNTGNTKSSLRSKLIGDRLFYAKVMSILIPMVIQQGITNLVNLLDNVMVGRLGTESISGVAVANQLIFIFNLMIFGLLAGASIYGAQYYGKNDKDGFHETYRYRLYFGIAMAVIGWIVFGMQGRHLLELYLGGTKEAETIRLASNYMKIICWQLIPFALVSGVGGALKDCGEAKIPMQASILAIFTNLVLNYLLIYGKFGFPEMGIEGAALATVIARYLELLFLLLQIQKNSERLPFMQGVFRKLGLTPVVLKKMLITGTPLFLNETLWSSGMTLINAAYATRGIAAIAATNINQTVWNLFGIICMSMGVSVGILAGQHLGANQFEEAKDTVLKVAVLSVAMNIAVGLAIVAISPFVPLLYNTESEVRKLASQLLIVCGLMMPASAYTNICYFTLRSGGKTIITFFFDCGFTWVACIPMAWILCRYTGLGVVQVYMSVQLLEFVKAAIGTVLIKSGIWINNVLPED